MAPCHRFGVAPYSASGGKGFEDATQSVLEYPTKPSFFLVTGAEKHLMVARVRRGNSALPATRVQAVVSCGGFSMAP
jgi:hypothetical protein